MGLFSANIGFTPVTKDSELVPKLVKALLKNKCRELIPESGADYQKRNQGKMQKLKDEFGAPALERALKLVPEDGQ